MIAKKGTLYCQRCSSLIEKAHQLPSGAYYCRVCLVFGRNQSDRPLLYFPPAPFPKGHYLRWQGQLTTYQGAVSHQLTNHVKLKQEDRKSTRLNSSHANISYAVFCLKKKKK